MKPSASTIHQLKVSIRGSRPLIWRLLEIPSSATLGDLHDTIQAAFGWENQHLWQFLVPQGADEPLRYGPEVEEFEDEDIVSSPYGVRLSELALAEGETISYLYDYGDEWELDITTQRIDVPEPGTTYPWCLDGAQASPPEDCGGIDEYQNLLQSLSSQPKSKEHKEAREILANLDIVDWFDAEHFDRTTVNQALARLAFPV